MTHYVIEQRHRCHEEVDSMFAKNTLSQNTTPSTYQEKITEQNHRAWLLLYKSFWCRMNLFRTIVVSWKNTSNKRLTMFHCNEKFNHHIHCSSFQNGWARENYSPRYTDIDRRQWVSYFLACKHATRNQKTICDIKNGKWVGNHNWRKWKQLDLLRDWLDHLLLHFENIFWQSECFNLMILFGKVFQIALTLIKC